MSGFLYRRLSKLIPCVLKLDQSTSISLYDKHQINSFADVFGHPFYWRIREYITSKPRLIIDCGSHCGHVSILFDLCIADKYGDSDCEYFMFEAHPELVRSCKRNIIKTNLASRARIFHGLLGKPNGSDYLYVSTNTLLTASRFGKPKSKRIRVNYVDLRLLLGGRHIDVMKVDIEGSEYDLISNYPDIFRNVSLLFIELHGPDSPKKSRLKESLAECGLKQAAPITHWCNQELLIYSRDI